MAEQDLDPAGVRGVKIVEQLITFRTKTASVSTSESLEDFFGSALSDDVGSVTINNVGASDLNYNVDAAAATATTGTLTSGQAKVFYGRKVHLGKMRIFAASAHNVSIDEEISE